MFVLAALRFSIILTWVFNHTQGSLLIATLVHGMINWSQLLTSATFPAAGTNENGPLIAFGAVAVVLVLATDALANAGVTRAMFGLDFAPAQARILCLLLLAARLGLWLVADGKIATVNSRVKG